MEHFWEGFEKRAGIGSKAGKVFEAIKKPFKGAYHFAKNVGKAAENINVGSEAGRKAAEHAAESMPRVEKKISETADKGMKYLKRGGLMGLGMYGASKAVQAPADIERYKYYHQQRKLSRKQLKQLDKLDHADGR